MSLQSQLKDSVAKRSKSPEKIKSSKPMPESKEPQRAKSVPPLRQQKSFAQKAKAQSTLCVNFLLNRCREYNCSRNHEELVEYLECGCCKHHIFGMCRFDPSCRKSHDYLCYEEVRFVFNQAFI